MSNLDKFFQGWKDCNDNIYVAQDRVDSIIHKLGEYSNPEMVEDLKKIIMVLDFARTRNIDAFNRLMRS